jgi:hypothetical protein
MLAAGPPGVGQVPNQSPRGVKRSRTPDQSYNGQIHPQGYGDAEDEARRKRGRPRKGGSDDLSPPLSAKPQIMSQTPQVKTPQIQPQALPSPVSAVQASPPKATPTKTAVVKALPTVRDHTTDQLNPEGDEYIPREIDESGERKVDMMGNLQGGRKYRCKTFLVPNRGQKLFMLATECARVLGYRDSYLLFNKNRSLFKIIASQPEKDDLIAQEILPYSYRSRQIAIVTARSMFRQFGSRVIEGGRRVRDDYWESKARKQGFTEEDLAGEKRPGATKARLAAQEAQANANVNSAVPNDIIYSHDTSHLEGNPQPQSVHMGLGGQSNVQPLPMISLAPSDDPRMKEIGMVPRPRQEITGPPYQDRIQPSPGNEILTQAGHAADFNKNLTQQRKMRNNNFDDYYREPRVAPLNVNQALQNDPHGQPPVSQTMPSPQHGGTLAGTNPPMFQSAPQQQHQQSQMMSPRAYSQQQQQHHHQAQHPQQQPLTAQSPRTQTHPGNPLRPEQLLPRSPAHAAGLAAAPGPYNPYTSQPGRSQQASPMWPPTNPQPSPMHPLSQYAHAQHGQAQQQGQAQAHQLPQSAPQMQAPMYVNQGYPNMYPSAAGGNQAHYLQQQQQPQHQQAHQQGHQAGQQQLQQNWRSTQQQPQHQQHQQQGGQQQWWSTGS